MGSETTVKVVARLANDEQVRDQESISIIPKDQVFVACKESIFFPITADVYHIPVGSSELPDFNSIDDLKIASLCMDTYDIPEHDWVGESPNLANVFEWFGMRSQTLINVPRGANYTFRLTADDGAKLYIDGNKVIDNDGLHAVQSKDGRIFLSSGFHKVTVEWFQGQRFRIALQLLWKTDNDANFSRIPSSFMSRP